MPSTKRTIVVTGFGPFGTHKVNASWVVVQELALMWDLGDDITLVIREIPVEYESVKKAVPHLWQKHKPLLMVHVGVSGIATALTLEQQAHNDGYVRQDVAGTCPPAGCCVDGADACLVSGIDMGRVSEEASCQQPVEVVVSHDPGRYLCDFSYYQSLSIDHTRTAFVHVPPLNQHYSAQEMALCLKHVIQCMLKQVS